MQSYDEAIDLLTKLVADFPTVHEYRADLATAHNNWGNQVFYNNPDLGAKHFSKTLDITTRLAADFPSVPRYQAAYASALMNWADVLIRDKNFAKAAECLEKGISYMEPLLKAYPQNSQYSYLLVSLCESRAGIHVFLGEPAKAAERLAQASESFAIPFASWKGSQPVLHWRLFTARGLSTA
jgi:hypothetical protein